MCVYIYLYLYQSIKPGCSSFLFYSTISIVEMNGVLLQVQKKPKKKYKNKNTQKCLPH